MAEEKPVLHLVCGKIAAGKSTLAARLAAPDNTVLLAEDAWIATLFAEALHSPRDYMHCIAKLRRIMGPHVVDLLNAGVSVVLDFQANTVESRAWMRGLLDQSDADHRLHVLLPPDAVCLERLQARNASGSHPFTVSEAQFHQISRHFVPPSPEEGFHIVTHETPA